MMKYFYRLMLVMFLIVGGQAYGAKAPANATIGTQATLTYVNAINAQEIVLSNIVVVTINPVYSVAMSPGITSSGLPGERITFPAKITNKSNIAVPLAVYLANGDNLLNVTYTIDTNGNGILDDGETTVLPTSTLTGVGLEGTTTPVLPVDGEISLIVTGTIPTGAPVGSTKEYVVHGRILEGDNVVAYTPTYFLIKGLANVVVTKTIGITAVPGAFVYTFDIKNTGEIEATDLVITDNLPDTVEMDIDAGIWNPFGSTSAKLLTGASDGYEAVDNNVDFSVVNNVMVLKIKSIPVGENLNGKMNIRVKPKATTIAGTVITNVATYVYNNGSVLVAPQNTNQATYTTAASNLVLEKFQAVDANKDFTPDTDYTKEGLTINPGEGIFYKLVATNTGSGTGKNITITDIIPQYTGFAIGDGSVSEKGKAVWRKNGGAFTEITSVPAVGANGNIEVIIPEIKFGDVIEIYYNVKVEE